MSAMTQIWRGKGAAAITTVQHSNGALPGTMAMDAAAAQQSQAIPVRHQGHILRCVWTKTEHGLRCRWVADEAIGDGR